MTTPAPTVLITGSSHGIGLALARIYAERGWTVVATCRSPERATDLQQLAAAYDNVRVERIDVASDADIEHAAKAVLDMPVDVLINNAGITGDRARQTFPKLDWSIHDDVMRTNVQGPMKMAAAFMRHVEASEQKKIISISSIEGAISWNRPRPGNIYFYKSSKAALNMMMNLLALDVRDRGVTVGLVSPGWVDSGFGGAPSLPGMISPAASAALCVPIIDRFDLGMSGQLITHESVQSGW